MRQAVFADYREYEIQEGRAAQMQCLVMMDWGFLGSDVCTKSAYSVRNEFHDRGQGISGSALISGAVFCVQEPLSCPVFLIRLFFLVVNGWLQALPYRVCWR